MKKVNSGMLSFAKGATLMFAVVAGMTTLYSCSDKIDMTGGANETPVVSEKLHVANSDNSRVTNYKSLAGSASSATRAESFSMPAAPAVPADAIEITTDSPTLEAGKNYVIKSGVTLSAMSFLTADANIYIESGANVTFSNMWTGWPAGNLAIYILDGANVTDKMKITNVNNVTLYNYSQNYRLNTDILYIQPTSAFYTNTDLNIGTKRIENNGVFYAGGNVTVSDLISGSEAKWYFVGDVTAQGKLQLSHNTSAVFEGKVVANELNTNSTCDAQFNCSAVFATQAVINNSAKVTLNGGLLQSPYVELNSSANLLMADGSKVETDLFYFANTANQYWTGGSKLILNSGFAVVQAKKFATDAPDLTYAIIVNEGQLGLVYDKCGYKEADSFNGNNGDQLSTISNVAHNEEGYTNVAQSECVPTGTPTDPEDKPYLDHIADVTTDHNHDISATCVYVNGSNAYVSYHNHGTSLHGCLEALSIDKAANVVTLLNYLESESQRDFNHLTVDNGFVLASGNDSNKGGIIAKAPLSGAGFGANGSADSLEVVRVIGTTTDGKYSRDANSIVRSGDNYLIASTEGFATYNATDFATVGMKYINEADVTASRGKFISLDKNNSNSVVALALNDIVDNKATVEINTYDAADVTFTTPTSTTITISEVTPVDGKNVCKIDGNNIYACLGDNGFKMFAKGNSAAQLSWKPTNASRVNGMDYDNNYIYLACGSAGVYVLDKAKAAAGEAVVVAKYNKLGASMAADSSELGNVTEKNSGLKSANFISVDADGYIYVAFGRDGFQVFKLNQNK